jgi:hypothetical protein
LENKETKAVGAGWLDLECLDQSLSLDIGRLPYAGALCLLAHFPQTICPKRQLNKARPLWEESRKLA